MLQPYELNYSASRGALEDLFVFQPVTSKLSNDSVQIYVITVTKTSRS